MDVLPKPEIAKCTYPPFFLISVVILVMQFRTAFSSALGLEPILPISLSIVFSLVARLTWAVAMASSSDNAKLNFNGIIVL